MKSLYHRTDAAPLTLLPSILFAALVVRLFSFHTACIVWGFLMRTVLQDEGVSLTPYDRLVDQASIFMSPRDRIYQLYPHILGNHFSCLLRHTWITLGLFLFPATTWELNYEVPQSIPWSMYSKGLHIPNLKIQKCTSNPPPIPIPKLLTPV